MRVGFVKETYESTFIKDTVFKRQKRLDKKSRVNTPKLLMIIKVAFIMEDSYDKNTSISESLIDEDVAVKDKISKLNILLYFY